MEAKKRLNEFLKDNAPNIASGISGMAKGWDTIWAKACIAYKIPLHCYIPFENQKPTSDEYYDILAKASNIIYCSENYFDGVFLKRDRIMVGKSDLIVAFLDRQKKHSGTGYTVDYAKQFGTIVINLF